MNWKMQFYILIVNDQWLWTVISDVLLNFSYNHIYISNLCSLYNPLEIFFCKGHNFMSKDLALLYHGKWEIFAKDIISYQRTWHCFILEHGANFLNEKRKICWNFVIQKMLHILQSPMRIQWYYYFDKVLSFIN